MRMERKRGDGGRSARSFALISCHFPSTQLEKGGGDRFDLMAPVSIGEEGMVVCDGGERREAGSFPFLVAGRGGVQKKPPPFLLLLFLFASLDCEATSTVNLNT